MGPQNPILIIKAPIVWLNTVIGGTTGGTQQPQQIGAASTQSATMATLGGQATTADSGLGHAEKAILQALPTEQLPTEVPRLPSYAYYKINVIY